MYEKFDQNDIKEWLEKAKRMGLDENQLFGNDDIYSILYSESIQNEKGCFLAILKENGKRSLGIFCKKGENPSWVPSKTFSGESAETDEWKILFAPLNHENAVALRKLLPYTAPTSLSGIGVTFGVGDRLGIASPGHLRLFKKYNAAPVLAQQSVRELNLTGRNYQDVLDAASWAVFQENYRKPWGADGDHLKTEEWVEKALSIGFTMLTADVSDYIHGEFEEMALADIEAAYGKLSTDYRKKLEKEYLGQNFKIDDNFSIVFDKEQFMRTVLIYHEAIEHASLLYKKAVDTKGEGNFDFELSIDETATPTTTTAHYFISNEAIKLGIKIASLAPRFVGEFQKAIDYIGDADKFENSFKEHVMIAKHFGYKISIHSGSDKFRVFPVIGKLTEGKFHIKTAGTNWLQALLVIAKKEPLLFRELFSYSKENYHIAREYYHITPNLNNLPNIKLLADTQLPNILENPDARQVLHITYGEILKNKELREAIYQALTKHIEEYWDELEKHIGKHLDKLNVKRER